MDDREPVEAQFADGIERDVKDDLAASGGANLLLVLLDQPVERHDSGPNTPRSRRAVTLDIFDKVRRADDPADRWIIGPSAHIPCARAVAPPDCVAEMQYRYRRSPRRSAHARPDLGSTEDDRLATRSEEHTSALQSLISISYAVFC